MNKNPPRIVELVGLAGAGKTTLAQALRQCNKRIWIGEHPYFRKLDQFPFFAWNTALMLSTFTRLYSNNHHGRWLYPREMVGMVILNGWYRVLRRQTFISNKIYVLDKGPLMILAQLRIFGPNCINNNESAEKWWYYIYKQWASTLDLIIWLDATDAILLDRVRKRRKWHSIKGQTDDQAFALNARFRSEYEQLISLFTAGADSPKVIEYDTGLDSLDKVIEKTLIAFGLPS